MTADTPSGPHSDPTLLTQQSPIEVNLNLPLYLTIRDVLIEEIRSGLRAPGDRLPSERTIAEDHGVARMTARKALSILETEGAIYSSDRRGYFVSKRRVLYNPLSSVNLMRQMRNQGLLTENIYIGREILEAKGWYADRFEVPIGTPLVLEKSVVQIEGRRLVYGEDCLLLEAAPGYAEQPYISPMTQNLHKNYGLKANEVSARMRVTNIPFVPSKHLGVPTDTMGISMTHVRKLEGQVVLVDRSFWLSDAVELEFENTPK
ncbi:GntR family transcriptional regulator [Pacificibacter sp. AS14]|uniref:GntR family transcriptional regulator n=1 Tax=Pacificibacter sp. AS14 TaxID=3135785 RepID=UPI0031820A1D